MNYELEPGDLINRCGKPALGLLIKKCIDKGGQVFWEYFLRSPNLKSWKPQLGRYKIEEDAIYKKVDEGKIVVYYGNKTDRVSRKC